MAESRRDMYFPGTEELAADEMRVISCGTGMPAARRSQAATCWLVELGNGDNAARLLDRVQASQKTTPR